MMVTALAHDTSVMSPAATAPAGTALVVGLGATGLSCLRYLRKQGYDVECVDTRDNPPELQTLSRQYPEVKVSLGAFSQEIFVQHLEKNSLIVKSPGVAPLGSAFDAVNNSDTKIIGDIELFAQAVNIMAKPVIAITGSNGKSTVTTLVGEMCRAAGLNTAVGGNLGEPALDLLLQENADLFVVELSSFQLETTYSLQPAASVVLNISADHMDRYESLDQYAAAKRFVYNNANSIVVNRDDSRTIFNSAKNVYQFGLGHPSNDCEFGFADKDGERYLAVGDRLLIPVSELGIKGEHNALNVLAAMALLVAAGYELNDAVINVARVFEGLPHRSELVGTWNGVRWINDSKGTNVGATVASIAGEETPIVLIAGGRGKQADFSPLKPAVQCKCRAVILFGEDADLIARAIDNATVVYRAADLRQAVCLAQEFAVAGDCVLFSPACASFDMFASFVKRGERFKELVRELHA